MKQKTMIGSSVKSNQIWSWCPLKTSSILNLSHNTCKETSCWFLWFLMLKFLVTVFLRKNQSLHMCVYVRLGQQWSKVSDCVVVNRDRLSRSQSPSVNGSPRRSIPIVSPTSRWLDRQQFKKYALVCQQESHFGTCNACFHTLCCMKLFSSSIHNTCSKAEDNLVSPSTRNS